MKNVALFIALTAFVAACEGPAKDGMDTDQQPEAPTVSEPAPAPASENPPASEECGWLEVHSPDYVRGTGPLTGAVRALPTISVTKTGRSSQTNTLEIGIDLGSVGCGDILVHYVELSVAPFADSRLRDLVGKNAGTLTVRSSLNNEVHFASAIASNLTIAPDASDLIFTWSDGIHMENALSGRIQTVVVDQEQVTRLIFSLPLPEWFNGDSLQVNGTALQWTDASTGQRFFSTF